MTSFTTALLPLLVPLSSEVLVSLREWSRVGSCIISSTFMFKSKTLSFSGCIQYVPHQVNPFPLETTLYKPSNRARSSFHKNFISNSRISLVYFKTRYFDYGSYKPSILEIPSKLSPLPDTGIMFSELALLNVSVIFGIFIYPVKSGVL